ncbi:RDD family protein [Psychromicrobium xiongbiense]|uniref:RDD family protein n=1 Tax=Psychromicrobium xiongbiense TaxID=3051184 RepID=UPI002552E897|nr:RDD family protein [Psychromicrobium sp. YIM S02556]
MSPVATCRNCGAQLVAGASFCTLCGAAVYNRAVRQASGSDNTGQNGSGQRSDGQRGADSDDQSGRQLQLPGIVPVTPFQRAPLVAPRADPTGVDLDLPDLVTASAGRRLVAKLVDYVLPTLLCTAGLIVGMLTIVRTRVDWQVVEINPLGLYLWGGGAALLSLLYWVALWFWEAKTGNTLGNAMVGIRTTSVQGLAPGLLAILVRNLLIAIAFGIAVIGGVVVMISNLWDRNDRKQGWHDKAAHTLVFTVKTGRNPVTTGGVIPATRQADAPLPTMMPVNSPVAGAAPQTPPRAAQQQAGPQPPVSRPPAQYQVSHYQPAVALSPMAPSSGAEPQPPYTHPAARPQVLSIPPTPTPQSGQQQAPAPVSRTAANRASSAPEQHQPPGVQNHFVQPAPPPPVASFAPPVSAAPGFMDAELEKTQVRARPGAGGHAVQPEPPAPAAPAQPPVYRLSFDDGRIMDIRGTVLIGRNPAGYDGEMIDQLIDVQDQSRSISKTHLHLVASPDGVWVTDRGSTNGSALVTSEGQKTRLHSGEPLLARPGVVVRFGDRTLTVGRP